MLSCREVARTIASEELAGAAWGKRAAVRIHLFMCRYCRRYAAQLRAIGEAARSRWGAGSADPQTLQALERRILDRTGASSGANPPPLRGSPPPEDLGPRQPA
jgi:hypothetical protein